MIFFKKITALICISIAVLFLSTFAAIQSNAQSKKKTTSDQNPTVSLNQENVQENISENTQENISEDIQDQNTQIPEKKAGNEEKVSVGEINPYLLEIPSIRVNALIEHLGLTPEGNMDMTRSIKNVAWYNLGPRPGEVGSAVIGGHYGYPGPAVFRDLEKLRKGDIVYAKGSSGKTLKFMVREIQIYKADEIVHEVFFSEDGKAHLNLVTCNGIWNSSLKTYNQRLVVFTDMIS